jgi:hypothetical protein
MDSFPHGPCGVNGAPSLPWQAVGKSAEVDAKKYEQT